MKREFIKKVTVLAATLAICTSFIPTSTYAAVKSVATTSASVTVSDADPVEKVTDYLQAVKNFDVDKAVSTLREVGLTESQQKADLSEMLKSPDTQVVAIKDVTLVDETNDAATLKVTLQYGDGSITKSPVSLEKDNGQYKFKPISYKDEVIQKATGTDVNKSKKAGPISLSYSQTELIDFDLDVYEDGEYAYSDSFSAQNIDYFAVNIWSGSEAELTIVKKKVLGYSELSDTQTVNGSDEAYLYLNSGSSVTNAKLRVGFDQAARAYGEVYAIS